MKDEKNDYELIEHHGIIGNMRTAALVSLKGVIDFLSFPRFDSPTIFASLLDKDKGGHFFIAPQMPDVVSRQLYIPGTAVLITRFFSDTGIAEVTDYMPLRSDTCNTYNAIVRKVKAVRGNIDFIMNCNPGFNYGRAEHKAYRRNNAITFKSTKSGDVALRLSSDIGMLVKEGIGCATFRLKESQVAHFILESVSIGEENAYADLDFFMNHTYFETIDYWRKWISQSTYKGRWSEIIIRSAITLKLLTSLEHGSVVAAATFGLPEEIGGDRNWDYRYTWIRDAAFTMFAFLKLGFLNEGKAFLNWIIKHAGQKDLHLIYKVDGKANLTERELKHFSGYKNSRPVRIGNNANEQYQLDMYGDLLDTIYIYNKFYQPITHELWELIVKEVEVVIRDWKKPDHGIWEIRKAKKELLHSRLMCWVAMDRAIKIGIDRSFPFPIAEWEQVRDDIYNDIFYKFWNEKLQTWVQYKKGNTPGNTIDASLLLMPLVHFITPEEPRWKKTMEAINKKLRLDVLVYRYNNELERFDGLNGEEGTFTMCSFWYIECLAKGKRLGEAIENFEKMLGYGNHLGLFAEQISKKGEHLGNFPQAFTHLGLISAALELDKQLNRISGHR